MAVSKLILGMNARNFLYIRNFNKKSSKKIADDKLLTKIVCEKAGVPTPKLLAEFRTLQDARDFDWGSLPTSFVVKPAAGYGGSGITIIRNWNGESGEASDGEIFTRTDLESKVFDILDGAFSLSNFPDSAFIEDIVIPHSIFKKIAWGGVPDIRVIVCNQVPIMAMLRLPTKYSGGRANLHLGALGVGIDLRTGITTQAIFGNETIKFLPDTKTKVRGIKIPSWDKLLDVAVRTQVASKLGYAGVDIVIDDNRGPLVLEVNARPGLSIQLANGASLRTRLERVAGVHIASPKAGIELARRLFAEKDLSAVDADSNVLNVIEKVVFIGPKGKRTVLAKIDSGAFRSAIDTKLAEELGLEAHPEQIFIQSGSGSQMRDAVEVTIKIRGKEIETMATHIDRSHLTYQAIIGRRDLKGFLIKPILGPDKLPPK